MKSSLLVKILLILLIASVLFSTWAIVTALDRCRFELERTQSLLRERESGKVVLADAKLYLKEPPAANAAFFDPKSVSGGRIIFTNSSDSKNMNSIISNDAFLSWMEGHVNETLASRNYEKIDLFEPQLAESWQLMDGGLRYRIKLRKGILWHDFTDPVTGKKWENVEMTAHDFKFYAEVIMNPKTDCAPIRTYMKDLKEIRVINNHEFEVIWRKKYFLSQELTLGLSPLPRHLYHAYPGPFNPEKFNTDHERNRIMIGVGPYRFVRWEKDRRIVLARWEKYYGTRLGIMPPIKEIAIDVIKHPNTKLQALIAGDIDETSITADQWIHRTNIPAFDPQKGTLRKISRPAMVYNYMAFNLSLPIFSDAKTRAALSHLVNRDRIIREVYHGLARPVTGPFYPDSAANDKTIPGRDFAPGKAKKLLAEAGWFDSDNDGILERNGKKLKFTLVYPNTNTAYQRMLPMIREDMAKAGVQMDFLGLEWSVCVQRLEKKSFEACMMGWSGGITPDPYQLWHSSQADVEGSSNFIHFKNKRADNLIEQIRVEFDPEKRTALYHQFHRLIWEEAPYVFMVSPFELTGISRRYRNLRIFPLGYSDRILWTPKALQKTLSGE